MLAQCFARHGIARTAIMAATFRSGSSYIGKILGRNGLKGIDQERFNTIADAPDPAVYCDRVAERFAGRVFPVKLMWPHRCALARALDLPRERSGDFAASFPGATWIHVTRRDTFRQAISLWRAKQSGRWHVKDQSAEPPIDYDFAAIDRAARAIALQDRLWNDFFACAAITPLRLVYEDVVADSGCLAPVLAAFGFPLVETQVTLRKQADDTSERHLDRYLTDLYRRGF
jgi:LPS sulfotransferase NodH